MRLFKDINFKEEFFIDSFIENTKYPVNTSIAVSIIIPIFNNFEYLQKCINSCINQTLENIEIILINDGSTDPRVIKLLKQYKIEDCRVKLIDKGNTGYGHSMNVGIQQAKGDYIGIVESDDFVLPDMYKTLYEEAKKNDCDFVKSNPVEFKIENNKLTLKNIKLSTDVSNYNRVFDPQTEYWSFRSILLNQTGIYKRKFLKKNRIKFNETPGASFQDNGFHFQVFCLAKRVLFLDKNFYMLRRDNPNSSVCSQDKVLASPNEFKFIKRFLKEDKNRYESFIYAYNLRKFMSYSFNHERIAPIHRDLFDDLFRKELVSAFDKKEINLSFFSDIEKSSLKNLVGEYTYNKACDIISIVIPVYNGELFIERIIKNLLSQTFQNFEIIIVNDGSNDSTVDICKRYIEKDRRIRLLSQDNKGAGAARNLGLQYAYGKYIIFIDCDDIYDITFLESAYNKISQTNSDIVITRSREYDYQKHTTKDCQWTIKSHLLPNIDIFSSNDVHNVFLAFIGWPWDKLYNRSFIVDNKLSFQEISSANDLAFVYMSLIIAKKISILDEYLITHTINNSDSISNIVRMNNPLNVVKALTYLRAKLQDKKLYEKNKQDFINYSIHHYLWQLKNLKKDSACVLAENLKRLTYLFRYPESFYSNIREYSQLEHLVNNSPTNQEFVATQYFAALN